jgi:NAD+ synthase
VSASAASPTADALAIDAPQAAARIEAAIRTHVFGELRRKGVVLGLSGGIDSSVVAALCARALGPERVLGLLMPDADSSGDSVRLGNLVAASLGIRTVLEDIGPVLTAAGCYARRDASIRLVVPEYGDGYRSKLVVTAGTDDARYAFYSIVVQAPDGRIFTRRLTAAACLGVVAATNLKQRTRKMMEYYHADRCRYAVAGTPNRLEYDQGFFVKNGDGAADLKPIAHLYKSQVYELARHLGIPDEIVRRPPTTDTYSLEQSQEEFYFAIPLRDMDLCLFARDRRLPASELAAALDWPIARAEQVYRQIDAKRRAAQYLHLSPRLVEPVGEAASQ